MLVREVEDIEKRIHGELSFLEHCPFSLHSPRYQIEQEAAVILSALLKAEVKAKCVSVKRYGDLLGHLEHLCNGNGQYVEFENLAGVLGRAFGDESRLLHYRDFQNLYVPFEFPFGQVGSLITYQTWQIICQNFYYAQWFFCGLMINGRVEEALKVRFFLNTFQGGNFPTIRFTTPFKEDTLLLLCY